MAQLNANIPYIYAYIRDSYLYSDLNNKNLTKCVIFGVKSILNKPLLFHAQLENGAVFWGMPLSAYCLTEDFDPISENENKRLAQLQWWDCQSNDIAVTCFAYLQGYVVDVLTRSGEWYRGRYLFTIDDYYSDLNAAPMGYATDLDSKCFHIIELDNGNIGAYPNNYCRWENLNFTDPYPKDNPPKFKPMHLDIKAEYE
jgi:hypothetical protein